MTDPLVQSEGSEIFKAGVHLGIFGLSFTCLAYNMMSYGQRKENHLLVNVIVYAAVTAFEVVQMARHWDCDHE